MDIALATLGRLGKKLGSGNEADVLELPQLVLPDVAAPLVYKRYKQPQPVDAVTAALVDARSRLDHTRRAHLDAITSWPVRRVVEHGRLLGVVLTRIPDGFLCTATRPSGKVETDPCELQGLMVNERLARSYLGCEPPDAHGRLAVCRDVAEALAFLHDGLDVVVGDISARNTLVRLSGRPTAMLVDCDGARPSALPRKQLNSPDWEPPEGRLVTDKRTDRYKLGLVVLRILVYGDGMSVNRDPDTAVGMLDRTGVALLRRALGPDPDARPSADEWFVHLAHALGESVRPPRLISVGVAPSLLVPGDTTTLTWEVDEACDLVVRCGNRVLDRLTVGPGRGRREIAPGASGVLRVRATNRFGDDDAPAGAVAVLSDPATTSLPVPVSRLEPPNPWPPRPPLTLPTLPPDVGAAAGPPVPVAATIPTLPRLPESPGAPYSAPTPGLDADPWHTLCPPPPWWITNPVPPGPDTWPQPLGEITR